jgi:hypothetical protein
MFVYGASFFLYRPGFLLATLGALLTFPLALGTVKVGPVSFSMLTMLLGVVLATLGLQCIYLGILAQVFFDYSGEVTQRWLSRFPYTRTVAVAAAVFFAGLGLTAWLLGYYVQQHFVLDPSAMPAHIATTGLLLMIVGFTTFTFTLLLHATSVVAWRR